MVIISTKKGKLKGVQGSGYQYFLGIPYAMPPVGDLRFQEPQPIKPWNSIKETTKFGTIAPQNILEDPPIEQDQDEDCLYLNIWTPQADERLRPVMFWIHGGAYIMGAGSRPRLNGKNFSVHGDVVVVTFNYRLGALGFLNFSGIPPNIGIQDQIAALKWVKENIAYFGGDPNNITIFGESAGGMSVAIMFAIPSSKGLFQKAIIQSGVANPRDFKNERSKRGVEKFMKKLSIRSENVDELRRVPLKLLMDAQKKIVDNILNVADSPFWPFIDGEIIPEQPIDIIRKGNNNKVPMIIGYNENEMGFLSELLNESDDLKRKVILEYVYSNLQKRNINKNSLNRIIKVYKNELERKFPDNPFMYWDAILSDSMFKIPIIRQLEAHLNLQSNIYCYIFSFKSPKYGFALHSLEIPFVFDTINKQDHAKGAIESNEETNALTRIMMDTWITFARTGNPNNNKLPNWPVYGLKKRHTMLLGLNPEVIETNLDPLREVWEGIL